MKQSSFSDLAYEHKKKTTRKERFLAEMETILPPSFRNISQSQPAKYENGTDKIA